MSSDKLVYSTDLGRIKQVAQTPKVPLSDGIVRIHKETKGRKGAGVSIIRGLGLESQALKVLCTELKKRCGCGGSVKNMSIEIQGDVRDKLKVELERRGHKVKLAGG
jgi:translation initiation factor 1